MANQRAGNVRFVSGLNIIAGAWLIIAPWVIGYSFVEAAAWNDVIIGAAVIILAGVRLATPGGSSGISWVNVALGVWLVIAPFILQYGAEAGGAVWNDLILGVIIAFLAWRSASLTAGARVR